MKRMFALLFALGSFASAAEEKIEFRYSELYSKMKYNVQEDLPDVEVRLYLVEPDSGQVCQWKEGWMVKDKHFEALTVPRDFALNVPIDGHLRQANPDVTFVKTSDQICDMSIEVLSFNPDTDFDSLVRQFDTLFGQLSGMFGRFFMPEVEGLTYHFNSGESRSFLQPPAVGQVNNAIKVTAKFSQ